MANITTFRIQAVNSATGTAQLEQLPKWVGSIDQTLRLLDGIGVNQADEVWAQAYTIADGGSLAINVNTGLTDQFGVAISMVKVKGIALITKPENTTDITVGGGAAPLPIFAGSSTVLEPGGQYVHTSPGANGIATVTATTADTFNIVNGAGATADIALFIAGTSA